MRQQSNTVTAAPGSGGGSGGATNNRNAVLTATSQAGEVRLSWTIQQPCSDVQLKRRAYNSGAAFVTIFTDYEGVASYSVSDVVGAPNGPLAATIYEYFLDYDDVAAGSSAP
jgi:hypothetical protein